MGGERVFSHLKHGFDKIFGFMILEAMEYTHTVVVNRCVCTYYQNPQVVAAVQSASA